MHRLALATAWWATVLSLSGCRTYENVTSVYTDQPDGALVPADGPGGRPPSMPGSMAGAGGMSGAGGSGGPAGSGGAGGSRGSDATVTTPPGSDAAMAPPPDAPPAPPPDGPPPSMNLNMGLVSRWKLDERTGTRAADSAATGNNATITAATWETACFPAAKYANPGCLRFDGTTAFVELATSMLPANNRAQSISVWASPTNLAATANQVLISLTQGAGGPSRLKMGFRMARVSAWKSGAPGDLAVGAAPTAGWHHYLYTYDGSTHRLFVDGAMQAMSTNPSDTGAVVRARLGANFDNSEKFAGFIDEVRIYNRALTTTEIAGLAAGYE